MKFLDKPLSLQYLKSMTKPSFSEALKDYKALLVVGLGSGLVPAAPGTWGTAMGVLLALPVHYLLGPIPLLMLGLVLFAVGIPLCDYYVKKYEREEDPSEAVIDEIAAIWIVLAFAPLTIGHFLIAFLLFRIFDIFKPWPVSLADRHCKGGIGVMLDDLLAAGYAILCVTILFNIYDLVGQPVP